MKMSLVREKAMKTLLAEGKIHAGQCPMNLTLVRKLGITYPNGSTPHKREAKHVLRIWAQTGNRVVVKSYMQEVRDTIAKDRKLRDGAVLTLAARATVKHVRSEKPRAYSAVNSEAFLQSYEWRQLRMRALKKYGARCQCCGASPATGAVMNVDHIKPRRIYPELALDLDNLQVLCGACNHGKGNWDMTDWRTEITV